VDCARANCVPYINRLTHQHWPRAVDSPPGVSSDEPVLTLGPTLADHMPFRACNLSVRIITGSASSCHASACLEMSTEYQDYNPFTNLTALCVTVGMGSPSAYATT